MLGWSAAALMVATFGCRDPLWMRALAVCTSVAFIAYGLSADLAPVLALHSLLLPINLLRWCQCATASKPPAARHGRPSIHGSDRIDEGPLPGRFQRWSLSMKGRLHRGA
jgi:hypothetical protein